LLFSGDQYNGCMVRDDSDAPSAREIALAGGRSAIQFQGDWRLGALSAAIVKLKSDLTRYSKRRGLVFDLTQVQALDRAGAAFLWRFLQSSGDWHMRPEHRGLFENFSSLEPLPPPRREETLLHALGVRILDLREHGSSLVHLLGQLLLDCWFLLRHPARIPWREISANFYKTGAQALGITALVGFLIGVVLAYLLARQLHAVGADIYIINLLGISIIRELGPVLAAVLVAGRSGSAITAQLGVMRVTQELDALSVLGISPTLRLVLPKIIALTVSLPVLILWTDTIALVGGMFAANAQLDLSYASFIQGLPSVVPIANFWLGLAKGAVFGAMIGLIACHFGLKVLPNTESLGRGTTNSVVTSITLVIVVDAVFAVIFSEVGIWG
jgi:phospholipid/cholesterol/gamma-HCH transport system permease protein